MTKLNFWKKEEKLPDSSIIDRVVFNDLVEGRVPNDNGEYLKPDEKGFVKLWEGDFGPFLISKGGNIALKIIANDHRNNEKVFFNHTETVVFKESRTVNHGVMFYNKSFMGMKDVYGVVVGTKE